MDEKLKALQAELKTYFEKAAERDKATGAAFEKQSTERDARIAALQSEIAAIQKQTDAIDVKVTGRIGGDQPDKAKSLGQRYIESEEYKAAKAIDFRVTRPIRAMVDDPFAERKATITTVGLGSGTSGILMPLRLPSVTGLPQQELRVRDLMTIRPMTTGNAFDYVRMLSRTNAASPQVEATQKAESTYTWETKSDTVKTIAHFTNVSRQAVEDIPWLQDLINSELMYGLLLKEEAEILAGDGTGQHLKGLITQATAYNTGANVAGDTPLDKLRHAKLQARLVGLGTFAPDGLVLNPTDMARIELIKDENGGANKGLYIIGDPKAGTVVKMVWGLPVVESDSIAPGTFLLGAFSTAAELVDRMTAMVEISWEHASNFTANLATILCEERIGLAVRRPEAFITGVI